MPPVKRIPTKYPGVFYIEGTSLRGKPERIYYVRYRGNGKLIEETAGRQYRDNMTPAKAAAIRGKRSEGDQLSNAENRKELAAKKEAQNNRWTFDRLWEAYKEANPGLKGIVTDNNRYTNHVQPQFGKREPKDIFPLDIGRLKVKLLKTRSAATTKNVLELIRRIINFGIKTQLCEGPGFTIKMPVVDNLRTEDLTSEQLKALLKALDKAKNIQVANLMRIALYTGMRRGELFRLQWRDVDFERGFILIRNPKGGRSQKIPLNSEARTVLLKHPRAESPFIFPGRDGGQRKDIIHDANKIKEVAGLRRISALFMAFDTSTLPS